VLVVAVFAEKGICEKEGEEAKLVGGVEGVFGF
jgi:hypothetical protein